MLILSKLTVCVMAVSTVAMASAATSQPMQEITIGLSSATLTTAPVRIAKEMGFFAKYGLEPKFVVLESGNASASALISGAIKFALAGPGELVVAQARGQKVVAIANTYRGLGATLVLTKAVADKLGVAPNAPASERLKALEGLLIGSTSATATYTVALRGAAKAAGANVRFAFMGPIAMGPALETGAIQGFFTSAPYWAPPVVRGAAVIWLSGPKGEIPVEYSPVNSVSVQVMREFAEANPELVRKVAAVVGDLAKAIEERPAEVKAVTAKLFPDVDAPTLDLLFASESVAWKTKPPAASEMVREIDFVKSSGASLPQIDSLDPASLIFPELAGAEYVSPADRIVPTRAEQRNISKEAMMTKSDLWKKGDGVRAELLGESAVARLNDSGIYDDYGMQELSVYVREAVFGMLWTRPGLDLKMRTMICVIMDVTTHSLPELGLHLRMARRQGWTEVELSEAMLHMTGYVGIPSVREAMIVAKQVYAEMRAEEAAT